MILLEEPTITCLSSSVPTHDARLLVPPHRHDAEVLVAVGGKVCYNAHGRDGRPVDAHVQRLVEQVHTSTLEHATFSFLITGISRGLSHELVRHRHFSFSQRSTRYTDESDERVVLEPRALQLRNHAPAAFDGYRRSLEHAFGAYRAAVEDFMAEAPKTLSPTEKRKFARGAARQLLPHALETQLVLTGNLRTWREVLLLRSSRHAEAEIRRLMHHLWEWFVAHDVAPNVFSDLKVSFYEGFVELT